MGIEWVPPTCLHTAGSGRGCGCAMAGEQTLDAAGKYIYMADLCKISAMKPLAESVVPQALGMIATPLIIGAWRVEHPDREFVAWPIDGMEQGFRIGYDYSRGGGGRAGKNMRSALEHPQPVDQYVQGEIAADRIVRLRDVDHDALQTPTSAQCYISVELVQSPNPTNRESGGSLPICRLPKAAM